jgi:hypothetical protein
MTNHLQNDVTSPQQFQDLRACLIVLKAVDVQLCTQVKWPEEALQVQEPS